ncbi:MAG: ABC transporter ATP-binding protein [Bacillota bacterium]
MENIIETNGLSKRFGKFKVVDSVSLTVRKGEIYGFLGLNGAGKTTTIRMLLGMIRPSSGSAYINGKKVYAGNCALWNSVGYLVEIPYSYPDLTVKENLEIIRHLRFIGDSKVVDSVMEKLQLKQYQDRKAKNLSLGNAQRLGLAKAIMHNPDVLILDEPANGLDPAGIVEIRELLHSLAHDRGVTVFVSSHILGEISKFATRLGIIHEGKLIQEFDIDKLESMRKRRLLVNTNNPENACSILRSKSFTANHLEDGLIELIDNDAIAHPDKINILLVQAGCVPTMLKVDEEDLEAHFLRIIGRNRGAE